MRELKYKQHELPLKRKLKLLGDRKNKEAYKSILKKRKT